MTMVIIEWNGQEHPSGIYFISFESGGFVDKQKVILMKFLIIVIEPISILNSQQNDHLGEKLKEELIYFQRV